MVSVTVKGSESCHFLEAVPENPQCYFYHSQLESSQNCPDSSKEISFLSFWWERVT
jgi:hypothetical protein